MKTTSIVIAVALAALVAGGVMYQLPESGEHLHESHSMEAVELMDSGECEACAMYVLEQPGPRGQLIYRDGTRRFFCSVGDLLAVQTLPSPLGKPIKIWVEAMPADIRLSDIATAPQPWIEVTEAHFVTGLERSGVMGMPALSFASDQDAQTFININGGVLNDWNSLKDVHKEYLLRK
jgi:nitrous oxide reductase accessory protein NosL